MTNFQPESVLPPGSNGVCAKRIGRLDGAFQKYIDDGEMSGASVIMVRNGQTAHLKTYGLADIETGRAVEIDTLFRIASMTKPITSFAVLQLVEEGKALLNDPIEAYLPEFSGGKVLERVPDSDAFRLVNVKSPMTIRHLLTHTSGLCYAEASR